MPLTNEEVLADVDAECGPDTALPFLELAAVCIIRTAADITFQRVGFQPPTEPITHNAEPVLDAAHHVAVSIFSDAFGSRIHFIRNNGQYLRH